MRQPIAAFGDFHVRGYRLSHERGEAIAAKPVIVSIRGMLRSIESGKGSHGQTERPCGD